MVFTYFRHSSPDMCFWTSPVPQLPERMCLCCPLWWGLPHHRASPTAPLPPLLCHIPSALMQIRLPTTTHPSVAPEDWE